jgi:KaiC/GvpD/RAD55 family RecA-like ATPase
MNNLEEEMKFVNLREGLTSKANLVAANEYQNLIKDKSKDWYRSLFLYNQNHKKIVSTTGTVSGIEDTVTNILYFDFDSKDSLELARQDAIVTAHRLIDRGIPEQSIVAHFTGNKGFSLEVQLNDSITPSTFKAIVFDVAGDLKTFDKVVNDPNRIIRLPNTKHQKSGLYKIPLHLYELDELPITQITELAKNQRNIQVESTQVDLPDDMKNIKVPEKKKETEAEYSFDHTTIDMKTKPKYLDEARWLLANGFFKTGQRNHAMLCLAATYRNVGYAEEHVKNLLTGVAEIQSKRTGEEEFPDSEIDLIISQVFSETWKGGQFTTKDPTNWLAIYASSMGVKNKIDLDVEPMKISEIESQFVSFVQNIEKNTIKTGIKSLDRTMPITVGSNVGIVAAPGAGKTALALNILENTSKQGITSVFASLDMHRNRLFEKLLYKVTGLPREEVYHIFKTNNPRQKELMNLIRERYGNVWFYDRSSATIASIRNYIQEVEQTTGEKVRFVMLDYFERVNTDVSDDTAASKKIANEIQDLVNDLDVAAIVLCQPNKFSLGSGPDTEITSYTSIKGSSFLYQSFRGIISLSRPFYTPSTKELDKYMVMNILKNDLGELDRLEFGWKGKTGEISELEDVERQELKELLKLKKENKDNDSGWD